MEYKTVSLADQVFERLETDILAGKYKRGEIITELRLCTELEVSRTPIREALRRLLQEHLVEETGKGTMVLGITLKDFEDMCAIRLKIEELAIRGFIDCANEDAKKELKEALEFQEFYLNRSDTDHIKVMDGRFHEIIYRNCGSMILCDTLLPLHKRVQMFRKMSIDRTGRAEKSVAEHREIFEAIMNSDKETASRLMTAHVANARATIIGK